MPDTKLANATGAYGLAISEYMLAGVLMLRKKLHLYQKNMEQHLWKDEGEVLSIRDSVTLVVGLGDIGSQFAEKMHALGSEVIGVRKHKAARPDYIKEVCQQEDLDRLLPKADIVACCMPGTGEIRCTASGCTRIRRCTTIWQSGCRSSIRRARSCSCS